MERVIKFRGKARTHSMWIYGFLAAENIINVPDSSFGCAGVIKPTVGQFTGLKDKNGKEIYEGDIVRSRIGTRLVAEFRSGASGYEYLEPFHSFADNPYFFKDGKTDQIEIIGNIHDNPELLQ